MPIDMNDPEVKEAIEAAIEKATEGLQAKNKELLGEVKKFKRGESVDVAELDKLQDELDRTKGELTKLSREHKKALEAAEQAANALKAESGFTSSLLIDQGLQSELMKAGVSNPAHLKAALALLKGGAQIVQDGDKRVAKMGDKALSDFVKEWAAGDEGKHFVSATQNSGGGAAGSGNTSTASKTMTRTAFEALPVAEKVTFSKSGGTLTD